MTIDMYGCLFFVVVLTSGTSGFVLDQPKKISLAHQEGNIEGDIISPEKTDRFSLTNLLYKTGEPAASPRLWQKGLIHYELDKTDSWDQKHLDMLTIAMTEIQDNTCIKFEKRTNEADYVTILKSGQAMSCSSAVGHMGGQQSVNLYDSSQYSCWYHEIIVHELLHSVGLIHEQMRPDRDEYLYIFAQNIDPGRMGNFNPCKQGVECDTQNIVYNYLSIMHYDITAFSSANKVTMMPKDAIYSRALGKAKSGHPLDYEKVRRMYGCPTKTVKCYQCDSDSRNTNCQEGSCTGEACYTTVWSDRIVKGCGALMSTFVGCRDSAQVGGCNTICGCQGDMCNSQAHSELKVPKCSAVGLLYIRANLVWVCLFALLRVFV